MHYYRFNIADYRKDTGHLSITEHYIYRSLLDWMYLDEKPIPKETQTVMRRLGLGTAGLASLNNVLSDFFIETENGYIQERVMDEIQQYNGMRKTNTSNGKKGGRPKKQQLTVTGKPNGLPNANRTLTERQAKKSLTINHKPITNNQYKESKPKKFTPPTLEDVKQYCIERGNSINPENFLDHYEANGWMRGKTKIQNWKACLRTWERTAEPVNDVTWKTKGV